jgi:hypothetical protein
VALDVLALLVTFCLAGALLAAIVVPERLGVVERLLLSIALAIPATVVASTPGLLIHHFGAGAILAGLAVLAGLAFLRVRPSRGRVRLRLAAFRDWRPTPLEGIVALGAAAAAWLAVLGPQIHSYDGQPRYTIEYYHWGVAQQVLDAGRIPASLPEWGQPRPFPVEYLFSAIHGAATGALGGGAGLDLLERYRIAIVAFALVAAFALARRWLPTWWAWLAAILTLSLTHLQERLLGYKPEMLAVCMVLWSGWLLDEALERRSPRWAALAGGLVACAYFAHPVGSIVAGPLWLGILVGRAVPHLVRRRGEASTGGRLSSLGAPARVLAVAGALFVAVFGATRGIAGNTGQNLLQSPRHGVDLTRVVYREAYLGSRAAGTVAAATREARAAGAPATAECAHPFERLASIQPFTRLHLGRRSAQALLAAAFIAFVLLAVTRLPGRLEVPLVTFAVYGLAVYAVGELICAVYHTWAPERVGPLRLIPYWGIALAVPIVAGCWALVEAVSRSARWQAVLTRAARRGAAIALAPAAAVSLAALLVLTPIGGAEIGLRPGKPLSPATQQAYAWIARNTRTDADVLANGYTEGAVQALSHRVGELDGRTPYLQPDPWRAHAIRELRAIRGFFLHPVKHQNALPRRVDYIIVGRQGINLGGSRFPVRSEELRRLPYLFIVQTFDTSPRQAGPGVPTPRGPDIVLYRVDPRTRARFARPG